MIEENIEDFRWKTKRKIK